MNLTDEQKRLLWLSSAEVSASRVDALIAEYGSAVEVWKAWRKPSGPTFVGKAQKVLKAYETDDQLSELIDRLEKNHVHLLFRDHQDYPDLLREIENPPYLLYYAGSLACLKKPCVAIVGTRTPSDYGRHMAYQLAKDLTAAGVTIISGLARGIDSAAHQGALDAGGSTVGIMGSGINNPYPAENTPMLRRIVGQKGVVFSEYPLDSTPMPFHFPYRNRIISGCSIASIFVEGRIQSGGMHTVSSALDQGREVFAVPGQTGYIGAEGPLAIMREGARLITCADDVLEDLSLKRITARQKPKQTIPSLTEEQRIIVRALRIQPMNIDDLSQKTGLSSDQLITELSIMEIDGLVIREAGSSFALPSR